MVCRICKNRILLYVLQETENFGTKTHLWSMFLHQKHIYKLLLDILMIKNGIDYFPGISLLFVTPVFFKKGLKAEFGNDNNCSIKLFNQLNNLSN